MVPRLFIRDDDACTLDKSFRFFFDAAMERAIPVIYAVIPGRMDEDFVRFMLRAKGRTPHLLDIVQHGWMHTNHAKDETKYEFGALRPLKSQRQDITRGLQRMRSAFADSFTPVFVPPFHGYDKRTLQILTEEDFQAFSAGIPRLNISKRFIEYPAKLSFTKYNNGKPYTLNTAAEMIKMLIRAVRRDPLSGVLTHHADFTTSSSRRELIKFLDYLKTLIEKKEWRILLFSDLGENKG